MANLKVFNGKYDIMVNAFEVDNPKALVFGCHGLKSSKDINMFNVYGEHLKKNNMCFYAFDFAGHGESSVCGDYLNYDDSEAELGAVIKYSKEKYGDKDIYLLGTSYGSEIVWDYENKFNDNGEIKKLVLLNSAIRKDIVIKKFFNDKLDEVKEKGFTVLGHNKKIKITKKYIDGLFNVDIYGKINHRNIERLFLHGTEDSMARFSDVVNFTKENNFKLVEFLGEDHVFSKNADEESIKVILKFFLQD